MSLTIFTYGWSSSAYLILRSSMRSLCCAAPRSGVCPISRWTTCSRGGSSRIAVRPR